MAEPPLILGILGSTRQGRRGGKVADWFGAFAGQREDIHYEPVDLRDWNLGFFDEPRVPSQGNYENEEQRRWAKKVGGADGFVWITPEYNHGYPASLKNALDHVYAEWNRKPVSFVSYGGPGGGARAVQQLRQVVIELQMVPLRQQVLVHRFWEHLGEAGFVGAAHEAEATALLDELAWWAGVLKGAREGVAA